MRKRNKTTYTTRSVVMPDGWLNDTGLTQKALADALGVHPPSISHWIKVGRIPAVHAVKIQAIIDQRQAARLTCPFCHAEKALARWDNKTDEFKCQSCHAEIVFGGQKTPEECADLIAHCYGDRARIE